MQEISQSEIAELINIAEKPPVNMGSVAKLLRDMWAWPDYVKYDGETLEVSTGGWSEHEYAISKLKKTFFWHTTWEKSERGGHYTFKKEGE